jgi:hypothetical protein
MRPKAGPDRGCGEAQPQQLRISPEAENSMRAGLSGMLRLGFATAAVRLIL